MEVRNDGNDEYVYKLEQLYKIKEFYDFCFVFILNL